MGSSLTLQNLPYTMEWTKKQPGWLPSALTVTGADDAAAHLTLIDQRKLPHVLEHVDCFTSTQVCDAIQGLIVRGAPAIGIAGAYAMVLWAANEWPLKWALESDETKERVVEPRAFLNAFRKRAEQVAATRPTAVNLSWGVSQVLDVAEAGVTANAPLSEVVSYLEKRALELADEDEQCCKHIGENGARVLGELAHSLGRPLQVQTHCNAGSLGTVRLGTATAAIYTAYEQGNIKNVWVDETRPVDQGARLTTWEMGKAGVPFTLVCDNMAGLLMAQGKVDAVIVGADRICANGDVANKIGTYPLALLAKHHEVPFYVAAPKSTFDESLATGSEIVIEEREPYEVRCLPSASKWVPVAPQKCRVYNPAFDITPAELVTKVITD